MKKIKKEKKKEVIEIHIYVHQDSPSYPPIYTPPQFPNYPGGAGPNFPNYPVTFCQGQ
jgi:hypothetical protein